MKSPLFAALVFCALAFPAMAQTVSPTISPTELVSQTLAAVVGVPVSGTNILLPIVIDKTDGEKKLEARLVNLQSAGMELGMERMILEGEAAASDAVDGGKDYAISWGTASLRTKAGGKVSTYIGKPLQSNVSANPAVKGGDSFTAEGDPAELLAAWKRLQEKLKDEDNEDKEDAEKKTDAPAPTKDFGEKVKEPEQKTQTQTPQFQVKTDPVTISTREGCTMNVDFDQMVAIVQERALQDGKEVAACQDTLTRYPLEKSYASCPVSISDDTVLEQYILRYKDPISGGYVQVRDCTPDPEKTKAVSVDLDACSLRHDMNAKISYQQAKKTYTDNSGTVVTIQDCQDTGVTYVQEDTRETCSPVINIEGKTVTFQSRRKITVNGIDQYISGCEPEATSQMVQEEVCTSPRYTHDVNAQTSYLNKTYYYNDTNGDRVNISVCQPSTVSFQQLKDETTCTASNDDSTKKTTLYGKTYIEEVSGTKVFITDCTPISPRVDYVRLGAKWRVSNNLGSQPITWTGSEGAELKNAPFTSVKTCCFAYPYEYDYAYNQYSPKFTYPDGTELRDGGWEDSNGWHYNPLGIQWMGQYSLWVMQAIDTSLSGIRACIGNTVKGSYTIAGISVDTAASNITPTNILLKRQLYTNQYGSYAGYSYACNSICSNATQGSLNAMYRRGDGSTYTDMTLAEQTKMVCGDGSTFNGKTE